MPLLVERGGLAYRFTGSGYTPANDTISFPESEVLDIAFVNNMPDAAVEDTEMQFLGLLNSASKQAPVRVHLFAIPGVPRGERTRTYLDQNYQPIKNLLAGRFDGVIVTGTEPKQPDLRQEPYWGELAEVLDWAEENSSSTVLSCLAAHAGALYSDGITRTPLDNKRFGVFEHTRITSHALTEGLQDPIRIPHSRWNELREEPLRLCGYDILTQSPDGGVDLFVKQKKRSLFVHFQGHPEYGERTLLKEYRRDVRRYLRKERETYPLVPLRYFEEVGNELLERFRLRATADRREEIIESFPESQVADTLRNQWKDAASRIYANWLQTLSAKKAGWPRRVGVPRTSSPNKSESIAAAG
jgi:homoserine O-succinyltransferase/O-acetyltransferase